jgi:hypothetical protein
MSVFKTAYDTHACNGFQMKKVEDAIKVAAADGQLTNLEGTRVYMVEGGASVAEAVPPFAHPIMVERGGSHDTMIVVDVRPFGRFDEAQWKFKVRNDIEYKLALQRAQLTDLWVSRSPAILQNVSPLPLALFSGWFSENVAKRYALDPGDQYKLAIYAAVYYLSLFRDSGTFDDNEKAKTAAAVSRALRVSAQDVMGALDEISELIPTDGNGNLSIAGIVQFCGLISKISIRLKDFNAGVLYSILGGTWYGYNAKEVAAVALEHPPTWMALLVAAFYERTFKHSGITKMVERRSHRTDGDVYVRAVLNLLVVSKT